MTIEQIKEAKLKLKDEIAKAVADYFAETGLNPTISTSKTITESANSFGNIMSVTEYSITVIQEL